MQTGENLSRATTHAFGVTGGGWIAPLVYGDDASGPWNREHFRQLKQLAADEGVGCGAWFNVFGGDPHEDAREITKLASLLAPSGPLIVDCETAYRYPAPGWPLLPSLLAELRSLTAREIGISTDGLNASGVWNGRTIPRNTQRQLLSCFRLGIRVLPQWYVGSPHDDGAWARPDGNMVWLQANGAKDGNFADASAPNGRGVPLSYVHGTLEVTGLEGADLYHGLVLLDNARKAGFTKGYSLYNLENMPDSDFEHVRRYRHLFEPLR